MICLQELCHHWSSTRTVVSGLFTEDIMYHYKNCNDELRQDTIEWRIIVYWWWWWWWWWLDRENITRTTVNEYN